MMKTYIRPALGIVAILLLSLTQVSSQTTPQSLLITRIYGITSAWAGECGAGAISNISQYTRQNNYHAIYATGTGAWTAAINYSDTSCSGPWFSFGSAAQINQASSPAIAYANGYHPYIQIAVTGNAIVTYSAAKDFFISSSVGSVSFPITLGQGGTGATEAIAAKDSSHLNIPVATPSDYNFTPQAQTGVLIAGGIGQSAALAPCPHGVNGSDSGHSLYISTVGTPEAVLITGGTCTSGAASGTVTFTPAYAHSSGWTVQSVGGGLPEMIYAQGTGGAGIVSSAITLYGLVAIPFPFTLSCNPNAAITAEFAGTAVVNVTGANVTVQGCTLDGNQPTATQGSWGAVIDISGAHFSLLHSTVNNGSGHGVNLAITAQHTVIDDVTMAGNMNAAISAQNATVGLTWLSITNSHISSYGCTVLNCGAIAVWNASHVVISNNQVEIGGNQDGGLYWGQFGSVPATQVNDGTVTGNTVWMGANTSFECGATSGSNFVWANNVCYASVTPMATFIGWEFGAQNGVISNPQVYGNNGTGTLAIYMESTNNIKLNGGQVWGLGAGSRCLFLQHTVPANGMSNNTISGLNCVGAAGANPGDISMDAYVTGTVANNLFENNHVTGNTTSGHECLTLGNGASATVTGTVVKGNTLQGCNIGIEVTDTASTIVLDSNLMPGTTHLFDFASGTNPNLKVIDSNSSTAVATAGSATINSMVGTITSESLTTAAGATYTLSAVVPGDALITAASTVFANVYLGTSTTGVPQIVSVTPTAGTLTIVVKNIHATNPFNGTIKIQYQAMTP